MTLFDRYAAQIESEKIAYPAQFPSIRDRWVYKLNNTLVNLLTKDERDRLMGLLITPVPITQ